MKRILLALCLIGLLFFAFHAGRGIPSSVFAMDALEEAKAEALAKGEPLIFVYTDPGST